jgi:hypothetical protein
MAGPYPPGHAALPLAAWPEADRHAWTEACRPGDPFDEGGRAAAWRPASRKTVIGAYGRWLGFLQGEGVVLAAEAPAEHLTPAHVANYVQFLRRRCRSVTVSSYLGVLHMMVGALCPASDWQWLCDVQARAQRQAMPERSKAARLVPQEALIEVGQALMCQAEAMPLTPGLRAGPRHPALLYRDGMMIALLAMRPLRQSNFLGLELDRHLCRQGRGWWIAIPGTDTKSHRPIEAAFPELLIPALERYLAVYRPLLLDMCGPANPAYPGQAAGQHVWVSRCGTALTSGALWKLIERHTQAAFGQALTPHLFRDCAATSLGDQNPDEVRLAAQLLGHASFQTTERHYIAAHQGRAARHHQQLVQQRRDDAKGKVAHLIAGRRA